MVVRVGGHVSSVRSPLSCVADATGSLPAWTDILALFCDMATNSNPGLTQFRQLIDGLNVFIHAHRLPKDHSRVTQTAQPPTGSSG